ncbi:lipopolysaccharide-induced tumor necrosis factor-alpha factor homolog [Eurosta solidaginis]|uniref:lipopolysaccharide-induced tumor necrosis factor-alpha factor homolog n=1 Tax=Eurosta solidaginis TaxID=178769 RepID=UPI003530BE3D
MDQKRAMLYPDIDPAHNAATRDQRISASAALGLPTEAPPSYDFAIASTSTPMPATTPTSSGSTNYQEKNNVNGPVSMGWNPSAPVVTTTEPQAAAQHSTAYTPQPSQHDGSARPVIVVQPLPQQQQPQSPQIQSANTSVPVKLGPNPCAVTCPVCGACKTTRMVFTPSTRTHVCAGLLCLAGWCCCACLVPYFMDSCRTGNHYCSQCNTFLGVYSPRKAQYDGARKDHHDGPRRGRRHR